MKQLLCISIRWIKIPENFEKVEAALAQYGDWMRISGYNWFVFTNSTTVEVQQALFKIITKEDTLLIIPGNSQDLAGWAEPWVWDWLRKAR